LKAGGPTRRIHEIMTRKLAQVILGPGSEALPGARALAGRGPGPCRPVRARAGLRVGLGPGLAVGLMPYHRNTPAYPGPDIKIASTARSGREGDVLDMPGSDSDKAFEFTDPPGKSHDRGADADVNPESKTYRTSHSQSLRSCVFSHYFRPRQALSRPFPRTLSNSNSASCQRIRR
jgi:hypothetical protein